MVHSLQLVGFLFVALFYSSKGSGGINSVVTSLSEFQSVDVGGFQFNRYSAPTLQDTSDALFLSSLFGCTDKVNLIGASKFISTLRNLDGGYCDQPGAISDAVSVRNAIVSLSYLGTAIDEKQTEAIGAFLDSLFDAETKLFAPRKGASGDIHSTAVVLEAYERLGLGGAASVTEKKNALKKAFTTLVKTDAAGRKYFYSITADNAYAVIAASLVGFDFGQKEAWAQYFENRQVQDGFWKGGFYSDSDRVDVTTNDATLSVQALYQLYGKLVNTIDTAALLAYANALPGDLRVATQSYKAIARSAAFSSLFKLDPIFATQQGRHRVVNGRIVTGSLVKPSLVVRSNFGIPQSALAVKVSVTFEGEVSNMGLVWDQEHQVYIGEDFFPTEGKLGAASFDYTVQWTGEHSLLSLSSANAVSIGYWSNVKLNKAISGGNEVEPGVGAVVEYGAAFALTATYGTAEHKTSSPLKQGPFEVILTVLDSSNAEIHRNVLDAAKGKPFSFNYQLNQQDIPAGLLTLKVVVKDTAKGIVHTEDSFTFVVHPQMVASNLNFAGDSTQYHIGDRVQITMVPANLPDLKTVLPFTRHPRNINLNVMATSTEVLFSVPGVFNEEAGHYDFAFEVKPTFDSLGPHSVTFSYHAANGDAFGLRLFNSGTNYLYDATENFIFTVLSKLVIQNDNAALKEGQQLQYGNEVAFTFKVFDEISKKNVWSGVRDANAYLVLEHEAGKASAFTSVRESVAQVNANGAPSHFAVQWSVSPNAPSGDAVLALVAQLPSGDSLPMLNAAAKPWRVNVKVGGDIEVTKKSYSGKLNDDLISFFVEFELSCQGKSLRGAQLSAVVSKEGNTFDAPVAIGSHGRYQLSWTQRSKTVLAGDYQINIYRQVDKRSAEALPFRTVIHTHVPPATSPLPVRTEFVILLLLIGSFVWVTFKKMEIQGGSTSKQVK